MQYQWHERCSGVFGALMSNLAACASSTNRGEKIMPSTTIEQVTCVVEPEKTGRRVPFRLVPKPLLAAGVFAIAVPLAQAGAEIKIGDEASLSVGLGVRASFTSLENAAPDGTFNSKTFAAENVRLYMGGQFSRYLKATFNTERTGGPAGTAHPIAR